MGRGRNRKKQLRVWKVVEKFALALAPALLTFLLGHYWK
jgi:hypothetical protein